MEKKHFFVMFMLYFPLEHFYSSMYIYTILPNVNYTKLLVVNIFKDGLKPQAININIGSFENVL